ncbi:MAG: cation diffusion facilitator family transporter [Saprospiraceae bacterium]|jgi:cation diffusion facilitator family transporter|nr:cation diffusion facilitator family transporter [Saprospiraceae bacterium]
MNNEETRHTIRVQRWVVITSVALFAIKVTAYFLTNSIAVLTDALESTVNVVTGFTGLYSLKMAARPRDDNHPYGHGKIELISASFEGILILVAGLIIIYESVINLLHPHEIKQLDTGIILISTTAAVNYLVGAWCVRVGKKEHSIALQASGRHLQSDTWTTVGIIGGLILLLLTGISWMDSAVAIIFAFMIIMEGYKIIRQTVAGITDEADIALLNELVDVLNKNKRDNWIDLHNLRVIKYGHVLHLDCHLTVPWYFNVNEAHKEVDELDKLIGDNFPHTLEMFVHTDGCVPSGSCRVCPLTDCPKREASFNGRFEWTFENITNDEKHGFQTVTPSGGQA